MIDTAIRMLEGLFGDGSSFDRESAVKALEQAILELNLGLSERKSISWRKLLRIYM